MRLTNHLNLCVQLFQKITDDLFTVRQEKISDRAYQKSADDRSDPHGAAKEKSDDHKAEIHGNPGRAEWF